jgi:hypothetical protein
VNGLELLSTAAGGNSQPHSSTELSLSPQSLKFRKTAREQTRLKLVEIMEAEAVAGAAHK